MTRPLIFDEIEGIEEGHRFSDRKDMMQSSFHRKWATGIDGNGKDGTIAIRVFNKYKELKQRPYWGNHFWTEVYCVDTVGLDSEIIRKYVKFS